MRLLPVLLAGATFAGGTSAYAADALKFGPPPSWVVPQPVPTNVKATDAPIAVLLTDEQIALDPGKVTTYRDGVLKIQTPQGLAAGNISLEWDPATETLTVNKLNIIRDGKVIDVLASGQTFTTLRRETNLDAATLDGTLTATIQPEGLQQGDELEIATTREHSDPVLKDHVQADFADWNDVRIESGHAKLSWPEAMKVSLKEWPSLPPAHKEVRDGRTVVELSGTGMDPIVAPDGAPLRFKIGRVGEASDFASWDQVAQLMLPLYQKAAVIPASGPLHDEVEKIRSASSDPKVRAAQALALVQDRVRYVALLMGQGGYVPASAETTWSRRFGDCKAKSTLLLAILHSLGIEAEPVLVQAGSGDVVADELPMLDAFNHVMVRAHIGGKIYWLDGTREGDSSLDGIQVPDFGWVLPLTANATLVHLVPPLLEQPSQERHVEVDASDGVYAPAAVSIKEIYRGDRAVSMNNDYSAASAEQRDNSMREEAKGFFDTFTVKSSSIQFDKPSRTLTISIDGTAKINWKDGWAYVPTSTIAFDADFERPAGPNQMVPFNVTYPSFDKDVAILRLPHGVAAEQKISAPVHQTLAGIEYERSETVDGDTLTVESSERSLVPEVAYQDAIAAETKLRALYKDDVYIKVPDSYRATAADLPVLAEQVPTSADDYVMRGWRYLEAGKYDEALADFSQTLKLDPNNKWALADRGLAHIWKRQFDEGEKDFAAAEAQKADPAALAEGRGLEAELKGDCPQAIDYYTQSLAKQAGDPFSLTHRAMCDSSLSNYDAAIADFTTIIAHDPKNSAAFAGRAVVEANKHEFDAAKKDIAAAEALNSNPQGIATAKAHLAMKMGDTAGVLAVESKWIADNPKDGSRYASRADTYWRNGKMDLALADSDQAIALGYKNPQQRLLRANIFKIQGKNDLVAKEADLLVQENPTSDFAFVAAAKSYAALGQREKAMQLFGKALERKPTALIYVNRAQVRPASDTEGKIADLDEAIKLDPYNSDALVLKAQLLSKQGKTAEALAVLDSLPKDFSVQSWGRTERAVLLFKVGRKADSDRAFADLESDAKSASDFNHLCWTKATRDIFLDSALKDCQQALKLSPGTAAYEDSLGMVLLKLGKLDDALKAYTDAIAKGSGSDSLMGRAFVYARKGDTAHAAADAAAARKAYPRIDETFADYGLKLDPAVSDKANAIARTQTPTDKPPIKAADLKVVSITQH